MIAVKYLWINCDEFHEPYSTAPCLSNVSDVFEIVHLRLSNLQRFEGRICLRFQVERKGGTYSDGAFRKSLYHFTAPALLHISYSLTGARWFVVFIKSKCQGWPMGRA